MLHLALFMSFSQFVKLCKILFTQFSTVILHFRLPLYVQTQQITCAFFNAVVFRSVMNTI